MEINDFDGFRQWVINGTVETEPPRELNPYDKLFLAILMDAIETLKHPQSHGGNRKIPTKYHVKEQPRPVADAWNWLMSDSEDFVLAFRPICEHFGWSHEWVRKQALEAIERAKDDPTRIYRVSGERRRRRA